MIKIGFFGTPDIASTCLQGLCEKYEISFVVTGEDKPSGRNQKLRFCPAKDAALCNDIPLLQPASLRDPAFMDCLKKYDADIYVVVAYGRIIPRNVFEYPRLKTINLHPSLLPKYRGAAPVQWALINGERETGVTVQLINEELDAGDIIVQERIALDDAMTAGDLYDLAIPLGSGALVRAIDLLASGQACPAPQDHSQATYCGKITRDLARLDWSRPARDLHNLVRGLNPRPAAWTLFRGKNFKIWKTAPFEGGCPQPLKPGELFVPVKGRLVAGTGQGLLEVLSLQPEAKKIMDSASFINGYRVMPGDAFGL
jgi:methionyl-tRNA formyltransferase